MIYGSLNWSDLLCDNFSVGLNETSKQGKSMFKTEHYLTQIRSWLLTNKITIDELQSLCAEVYAIEQMQDHQTLKGDKDE